LVTALDEETVSQADVITNSGNVRPIDKKMIDWMKPTAVIPLMYEAWELRSSDVDVGACQERGIRVAGTNERHPAVDVFGYLGVLAVRLLHDAGIPVYGSKVLLLCDNEFSPYIERGLVGCGANVTVVSKLTLICNWAEESYQAILIALKPGRDSVVDGPALETVFRHSPGTTLVQFWGDLDRSIAVDLGFAVWPEKAPREGHMGILLSAVGPDAIVCLQAAGLKVGQVLSHIPEVQKSDREYCQFIGISVQTGDIGNN
jgi:hypothetical protein